MKADKEFWNRNEDTFLFQIFDILKYEEGV